MYRYKNNVYAIMHGESHHPDISGMVTFGRTEHGTLITAEIYGLSESGAAGDGVFPFCIHNGSCMSFDENGEFCRSEGCFNPDNNHPPMRAGDLPPLFSCGGFAYMQVVTNRFSIEDIIGKSVIIHALSDEPFSCKNAENSKKIACGIILSAG